MHCSRWLQIGYRILGDATDGLKCEEYVDEKRTISVYSHEKLISGVREGMEPGAASYKDRLKALKAFHDADCKTWMSMEPYPTPNLLEQDLNEILETVAFADKIIFGRTNYCKTVSSYKGHKEYYNKLATEVITFCEGHGIQYHIKNKTITKE